MTKRRMVAGAVDLAVVAGWVAVVVAVALALPYVVAGLAPSAVVLSGVWEGAVVFAVIVPVSVGAALAEWLPGTPGKRWQDLQVFSVDGGLPGFGPCLARDALKYGLPLAFAQTIGMVALSGADAVPVQVWILGGLAVALVVVYVDGVLMGNGVSLYDFVSGTRVGERVGRRAAGDDAEEPSADVYRPRRAA